MPTKTQSAPEVSEAPETPAAAPIPMDVKIRPWDPGMTRPVAPSAYAAIAQVDPTLLPKDAVEIARRSHRYDHLQPRAAKHVDAAITQWRLSLADAVRSDAGQAPDLESVAVAISMQAAARETRNAYMTSWDNDIAPLAAILSRDGDYITTAMRDEHDSLLATFSEAVAMLAAFTQVEQILGNDRASADYQLAGRTLARLERIRTARRKLDQLRPYRARLTNPDLIGHRKAPDVRGVKLPKAPTLSRWRALAEAHAVGEAWLPTKAEAEQRDAELHGQA